MIISNHVIFAALKKHLQVKAFADYLGVDEGTIRRRACRVELRYNMTADFLIFLWEAYQKDNKWKKCRRGCIANFQTDAIGTFNREVA